MKICFSTYSSKNSSSQTGSRPVLTLVRATLTWLREMTQKGFGTSLNGNLHILNILLATILLISRNSKPVRIQDVQLQAPKFTQSLHLGWAGHLSYAEGLQRRDPILHTRRVTIILGLISGKKIRSSNKKTILFFKLNFWMCTWAASEFWAQR